MFPRTSKTAMLIAMAAASSGGAGANPDANMVAAAIPSKVNYGKQFGGIVSTLPKIGLS